MLQGFLAVLYLTALLVPTQVDEVQVQQSASVVTTRQPAQEAAVVSDQSRITEPIPGTTEVATAGV